MLKNKRDLVITLKSRSEKFKGIESKDVKIRKILKKENTTFFANILNEDVVLKFSRRGYALNEANAFQRLAGEGYSVPKLIDFIQLYKLTEPEWEYGNIERRTGLLIYEFIPGVPLSKKGEEELINSMRFLKRFHEDPRHKVESSFIPNFKEVEVDRGKKYAIWAKDKGLLKDVERRKIEDFLNKYKEVEIKEWKVIHGDYSPSNLIESDNKIFIVDLEGFSEGADEFKDLGVFLAEVDKQLTKGREKPCLDKIIDAYSRNLNDEEEFRRDFFRVRRYLVFLKYDENWRKRARDRILSIIESSEKI